MGAVKLHRVKSGLPGPQRRIREFFLNGLNFPNRQFMGHLPVGRVADGGRTHVMDACDAAVRIPSRMVNLGADFPACSVDPVRALLITFNLPVIPKSRQFLLNAHSLVNQEILRDNQRPAAL